MSSVKFLNPDHENRELIENIKKTADQARKAKILKEKENWEFIHDFRPKKQPS